MIAMRAFIAAHPNQQALLDLNNPTVEVVLWEDGVAWTWLLVGIGENTATLQDPCDRYNRRLGRLNDMFIAESAPIEWREIHTAHRNYAVHRKPALQRADSAAFEQRKRESAAGFLGRPDAAARGRLLSAAQRVNQQGEGPRPSDRKAWRLELAELTERGLKRCPRCRVVKPLSDFKAGRCAVACESA